QASPVEHPLAVWRPVEVFEGQHLGYSSEIRVVREIDQLAFDESLHEPLPPFFNNYAIVSRNAIGAKETPGVVKSGSSRSLRSPPGRWCGRRAWWSAATNGRRAAAHLSRPQPPRSVGTRIWMRRAAISASSPRRTKYNSVVRMSLWPANSRTSCICAPL